jgi:putative sigma-54 modulation protein
MRIHIQAKGFELTPALKAHTERRLQLSLSWAIDTVKNIDVRLSDINGPRGGNDKRCAIQFKLGEQTLLIQDTDADLYIAIDHAADRCKHTALRRIGKMHARSHSRVSNRHEMFM